MNEDTMANRRITLTDDPTYGICDRSLLECKIRFQTRRGTQAEARLYGLGSKPSRNEKRLFAYN